MSSIIKVNTYQDANGNALFSSDGSGNVTTSASGLQNTPSFCTELTGTQSISTSTTTIIQFDSEILDTDNCYDLGGTHRFTPNVAGYYFLFLHTAMDTGTDFDSVEARIFKNNGQLCNAIVRNEIVDKLFTATIVHMNGSTDYVDARINQSSGGSVDLRKQSGQTVFGGHKIIGA